MPISTVVTSMKNEAPYILEWVAYHRALGFDRVVVVANDCTDGTHEMLLRLDEMEAISYYENVVPVGKMPHPMALKIANRSPEVRAADFIMVLDADEFLVVKRAPHTLDVLLDVMNEKSADMMVVPWRLFGSSYHTKFEDRPVTERFTQSRDVSELPKAGVKTLFRRSDFHRLGIHFPRPHMKGGKVVSPTSDITWVDAGGQLLRSKRLSWNGGGQTIHRDYAEVAHYMIKSLNEYLLKIIRGDGLMNSNRHGIDYWRKADHNQVTDLVVAENLAGFREERDRLFADPLLADLHRKAVSALFERLETLLANPQVLELQEILGKSTAGKLRQEDIARSRELVTLMSPKVDAKKMIEGDIPHSTLLSIADTGLADSHKISARMFKQARSNKAMFWPEKDFGKRPRTKLVEGLKRAQKSGRPSSLGARWFHNYQRTTPTDSWLLDEEILVVLTRDDDQILAGFPTYISQTKAKYVQKSHGGFPPLREVLTGTETPEEVDALIKGGKMNDPRLRVKRFLDDNPQAIELNLDHPEKVSAALRVIEGRGPSGPSAAKLLRESLAMDLPEPDPSSMPEPSSRPDPPQSQPDNHAPEEPENDASAHSLQIGILTLPMNRNYGGNLQAFALTRVLRDLGHRPVLLNRRQGSKEPSAEAGDQVEKPAIPLYSDRIGLGKNVQNRVFIEEHMAPISRPFYSSSALGGQIAEYGFDALIVGSDQVWRPKYARGILDDFFLGFLDETDRKAKRIAYAASFGSEADEYRAKDKASELLQRFDAVSVREDSAVDLCRDMFGVKAQHVLDPTLLLSKNDYTSVLSEGQRSGDGKHLLTYVLDATPDKLDVINKISAALSKEPRTTSGRPFVAADPLKEGGGDKSVEAWLASFNQAAYVVTDSFHGVAFSIIFNRPFLAYGNADRGLAGFQSLLKVLGLEDRIVVESGDVDIERLLRPIDWDAVNGRLDALKAESLQFLTDALCDVVSGGEDMELTNPAAATLLCEELPAHDRHGANVGQRADVPKPVSHQKITALRVFWFRRNAGAGINFGDDLGPMVVRYLTGRDVEWAAAGKCDLASIGSILSQVSRDATRHKRDSKLLVWGSGLIEPNPTPLHHSLVPLAVRGGLTRDTLQLGELPMGDPGIFAADIVPPSKRVYRWGIVPHYSQRNAPEIKALAKEHGCVLIDPTNDPDKVLSYISACASILSSSLHGLIVADSYGLPCCWLNVPSHKSHEFKFMDYCNGVNRRPFDVVGLEEAKDLLRSGSQPDANCIPKVIKDRLTEALLTAL